MLAPAGQRHTELPDSWGQWGPQFPTVPLPSGRSAPSLEFKKPPGGHAGCRDAGLSHLVLFCWGFEGQPSFLIPEGGWRACLLPSSPVL